MKVLFAASTALLLSAPLASSETAVLAAFACGAQEYRLLHDDRAAEPFSLARVDIGGRRLLILAVPESSAPTAEDLCATVERICGETRVIAAAAAPQAPACIAGRLD